MAQQVLPLAVASPALRAAALSARWDRVLVEAGELLERSGELLKAAQGFKCCDAKRSGELLGDTGTAVLPAAADCAHNVRTSVRRATPRAVVFESAGRVRSCRQIPGARRVA